MPLQSGDSEVEGPGELISLATSPRREDTQDFGDNPGVLSFTHMSPQSLLSQHTHFHQPQPHNLFLLLLYHLFSSQPGALATHISS